MSQGVSQEVVRFLQERYGDSTVVEPVITTQKNIEKTIASTEKDVAIFTISGELSPEKVEKIKKTTTFTELVVDHFTHLPKFGRVHAMA